MIRAGGGRARAPTACLGALRRDVATRPIECGRLVGAAILAGLAAVSVAVRPVAGQSIAERVRDAPAGEVRLSFDARPGVCGDGENVIRISDHRSRDAGIRAPGGGDGAVEPAEIDDNGRGARGRGTRDTVWLTWDGEPCEPGPVRVELETRGGEVVELDAGVGGRSSAPGEGGRVNGPENARAAHMTDLGMVPAPAAASYLLALAREADEEVGEEAVFAATLADGVTVWPELLDIARERNIPEDTRKAALFWLGEAAGEAATAGLESIIESEDEIEVREAAVFALSQRPEEQAIPALLRVARTHPEPRVRERAFFWLAEFDDPRVLELFEDVLIGG